MIVLRNGKHQFLIPLFNTRNSLLSLHATNCLKFRLKGNTKLKL